MVRPTNCVIYAENGLQIIIISFISLFFRRKFGLVCAFLNQAVFLVYLILIVIMMKYLVVQNASYTKLQEVSSILI
jgi:hypothetical protein